MVPSIGGDTREVKNLQVSEPRLTVRLQRLIEHRPAWQAPQVVKRSPSNDLGI